MSTINQWNRFNPFVLKSLKPLTYAAQKVEQLIVQWYSIINILFTFFEEIHYTQVFGKVWYNFMVEFSKKK